MNVWQNNDTIRNKKLRGSVKVAKEIIEEWLKRFRQWGAVAQWIERATDNRVVARSNPTETAWKLWQFPLPHFASVFRKRH